MSNQHVLKIHPAPLADLLSGDKTCEVRCNDRGFQVGDTVRLMEVNPETGNWTGAADHVRTISHIQTGYGLPEGMCVLSYAQAEQQGAQAGDERAAFEAWHRSRFATAWNTGDPTRDMHNGIKAGKYGPEEQQIRWECWQARAALATQPAEVDAFTNALEVMEGFTGEDWTEMVERFPLLAVQVEGYAARKVADASGACQLPPEGWECSRTPGHEGPCAAYPATQPAVRGAEHDQ